MVRRHKRRGFVSPEEKLEKLRPARQILIAIRTEYPINGEAYQWAGEAINALDHVAGALIGDREYFRTKLASSSDRADDS